MELNIFLIKLKALNAMLDLVQELTLITIDIDSNKALIYVGRYG